MKNRRGRIMRVGDGGLYLTLHGWDGPELSAADIGRTVEVLGDGSQTAEELLREKVDELAGDAKALREALEQAKQYNQDREAEATSTQDRLRLELDQALGFDSRSRRDMQEQLNRAVELAEARKGDLNVLREQRLALLEAHRVEIEAAQREVARQRSRVEALERQITAYVRPPVLAGEDLRPGDALVALTAGEVHRLRAGRRIFVALAKELAKAYGDDDDEQELATELEQLGQPGVPS